MAQFESCIRSALNQGILNQTEADDLIDRYNAHYAASVAAGAPIPHTAAQAALMASVAAQSAQKKAIAAGSVAATTRIRSYLETFRDLSGKANVFEGVINLIENFGAGAATSSIAGRTKAIVSLAHGDMADLLSTFRRSRLTGQRFNRPQLDNVVREVLGEATGSVEARGMADAVSTTFETLRQDFNKAAGFEAIGKLPDGYIPQFHDAHALLRTKYPAWRDYIAPKLDLVKMRDPLTGGPLSPARLEDFLKVSFDHITTGGWSDREPSMMALGKGAVANQRSDHRFIHFKTAADWLQYNKDFGRGDPIKSIFQHVNGMARDIAAMEVLGPNPNATVNWLKQVIASEAGKSRAGVTSLYKGLGEYVPADEAAKYAGWRVDAMYGFVRGRETISGKIATGFGNTRNVLTSAQLGGASILAAATDPFIDMATRYMAGLPATKALWGIASAIRSTHTREQAVRSGMILDDFLHIVGDEARYAGTLGGSEWSKWLADRTVNLNGLEPITQARRHVFGLDFQATIADHAAHDWDALATENRYLRRTLESYGFDKKEWNALRKTTAFAPNGGAGFIQPADISNRDIAKRYLEMIYGETERAVPTGTIRSRSFVTGRNPRGTWQSEILESGLQYKSFALSFTTLQWQAIKQELNQGPARGAAYAGSLAVALTLGGALVLQIKNMAAGKDLQPMDASTGQGLKFWTQSLQTGGGFGVMGDFLFSDQTRFGGSFTETLMGPTAGLISDAFKLTVGNAQQAIQGKKTNIGRETVRTVGKYVPIVSTLPYTRAAYQRMFLDQLQYLADPEASKYFHEQSQRMRHETGQGYFWPPGETQPTRGPQMSTAQH
jgi:hypothetical protein